MLVYAHRGFSGRFPENTLMAFREAMAAGVDGIEIDVHVTADGTPVVLHDREVSRTTNGSGNIDEIVFADVRWLDAGRGERVPTLGEVLDLVADTVHLDIEIKGLGAERATLDVLTAFPRARWAISSFDWDILRRLRELASRIELWPLAELFDRQLLSVAAELGSPAVSLCAGDYSVVHAELLRRAGLRVVVWTVNDGDEALRMRERGAYALCTDEPDHILRSLHD